MDSFGLATAMASPRLPPPAAHNSQLAIRNSKFVSQPNAPNRQCVLAMLGQQSVPPLLADSRRGQLEARTDGRPSNSKLGRRARHATLMPGGSLLATPGTGPVAGARKSGTPALELQRARYGGLASPYDVVPFLPCPSYGGFRRAVHDDEKMAPTAGSRKPEEPKRTDRVCHLLT